MQSLVSILAAYSDVFRLSIGQDTEACSDAVETIDRVFCSEFYNILGLVMWHLSLHNLSGDHLTDLERDESTISNLGSS